VENRRGSGRIEVGLILQWLSVLAGLAAAVLWWLSAQNFFSQSQATGLPSGGQDGDTAYSFSDGTILIQHNSRVALTNAWAAELSGLAVLLQAIVQALPLAGLV
jgi:high-affinity Fe2+/Pb2+ permease